MCQSINPTCVCIPLLSPPYPQKYKSTINPPTWRALLWRRRWRSAALCETHKEDPELGDGHKRKQSAPCLIWSDLEFILLGLFLLKDVVSAHRRVLGIVPLLTRVILRVSWQGVAPWDDNAKSGDRLASLRGGLSTPPCTCPHSELCNRLQRNVCR